MGANGLDEYWVPEHVKDYLRKLGFVLPLDDMEPWIRSWDDWMSARGILRLQGQRRYGARVCGSP